MAASGGSVSYGSKIQYDSGGGSYVDIAEVVSYESPEIQVTSTEFTHLQSDNNYKEFKPGMIDGDKVSCEINFKKATITLIKGWVDNGTVNTFRFVTSQGSYLQASAFVTNFKPYSVPLDDKLGASATFKITGKPTFTEV